MKTFLALLTLSAFAALLLILFVNIASIKDEISTNHAPAAITVPLAAQTTLAS